MVVIRTGLLLQLINRIEIKTQTCLKHH